MDEAALTEELRTLLREYIWTHEQLEVLLLLRGATEREWTCEEICVALRMERTIAEPAIEHLASKKLIHPRASGNEPCRYRSLPSERDDAVERLGHAYRSNPIVILKCMGTNAIERVRTAAMRAFADSFLLRRDPDG